jgi:hypothetical protein
VRLSPCAKAPGRATSCARERPIRMQRLGAQNIPQKYLVFLGIKKDLIDVCQRTSAVLFDD